MFSVHAFFENFDGANADNSLNAVVDQSVFVETTQIRVPDGRAALIAEFMGTPAATRNYARVETPSLRTISNQYLPIMANAVTPGTDLVVNWHPYNPRMVEVAEPLQMVVNTDDAAVQDHYGLVWLADGPLQEVNGKMFTTRATSAIAQAAGVWTVGNLTFQELLPVGRYQVLGMKALAATGVAARLVFSDSEYRPGVLITTATQNNEARFFRDGRMGVWGEFHTNQPPRLEVLAGAATAQTVHLDLVRLGQ